MKFYESLFILQKCITNINAAANGVYENLEKSGKNEVRMIFTNYIIRESLSFMDEFDNYFIHTEPEYHKRMLDIGKITEPVRIRINRWTDLKRFRNNIVAHVRKRGTLKI